MAIDNRKVGGEMERRQIIAELRKFFNVEELVCVHTFAKWGENAWQFLDTAYLHTLLIVRKHILQRPMMCNYAGMHQRGLRCNKCELVAEKRSVYLSSHILGKAGDFTIDGMTAGEAREKIKKHAHLLPYPIRMEKDVSWLHIDTLPQSDVNTKVYEFKG